MITKPTEDRIQWTPAEGDVEIPSGGKQSLGFVFKEKLGSKIMNWFMKRTTTWFAWYESFVDSIEITQDTTITVDNESAFDAMLLTLNNIHRNDYTITVSGTYAGAVDKAFELNGIKGKGEIVISLNATYGHIKVKDVTNNVLFSGSVTVTQEDDTAYGREIVDIRNCDYVKFSNIVTIGFTGINFQDDEYRCLYVSNSHVDIEGTPTIDGEYGASGLVRMKYIVEIVRDSDVRFNGTPIFKVTDGTAWEAGFDSYAYIYKDANSYLFMNSSAGFDLSDDYFIDIWTPHYTCYSYWEPPQLLSSSQVVIQEAFDQIKIVDALLQININDVYKSGATYELKNIGGAGRIQLENVQALTSCNWEINDIRVPITITDLLASSAETGVTSFFISNCPFIDINSITYSNSGNTNTFVIKISRCSGNIDGITVTAIGNTSDLTTVRIGDHSDININSYVASALNLGGTTFNALTIERSKVRIYSTVQPTPDMDAKISGGTQFIYRNVSSTFMQSIADGDVKFY
jgi:hypothetical protein